MANSTLVAVRPQRQSPPRHTDTPSEEQQVEALMGLVPWAVRRDHRLLCLDADDRQQIGRLAILIALRRYDPTRGVKLLSFAARGVLSLLRAAMYAELTNKKPQPLGERDAPARPERVLSAESVEVPGLDRLRPGQRFIISALFGLNGAVQLTPRELASKLGCSLSNVYKRRDTALAALRGHRAA